MNWKNTFKEAATEIVSELEKTEVVFLGNKLSLLCFYFGLDTKIYRRFKLVSVHFGVKPERNLVYIHPFGREIEVNWPWVLGSATDTLDRSLKYFGLGPLMLVCWAA